jgi:P27 family predicted phage terminase small subunit
LDPEAAAHWDHVLDLMESAGTLSLLDADALGLYVDAWNRYREARARCRREGWVVTTAHGTYRSPWYGIMIDALKTMQTYGDRFGLTPRSRSRLKLDPIDPEADGKWAGFGVVDEES